MTNIRNFVVFSAVSLISCASIAGNSDILSRQSTGMWSQHQGTYLGILLGFNLNKFNFYNLNTQFHTVTQELFLGHLFTPNWGIMLFSSFCFIVLAFVVNVVLVDNVMMPVFYVAHYLMVAITALYLGAFASFIASLFPTSIRFTGIAFSYNISLAIFGGFAPMVVTAMIKGGILLAPGVLLTFSGLLAFVTLLFSRELAKY